MSRDSHTPTSLFTQVDISANSTSSDGEPAGGADQTHLLRSILASQDRQNELLEELVSHVGAAVNQMGAAQRQRAQELSHWKEANPQLAQECRRAAETLSRVQTEFLGNLTTEISESADVLMGGEFMMNEFVDRFGPRLAHLNGVLQVLSQLSNTPASNTNQS